MAGKKRGRPRKARTYAGRPAAVSRRDLQIQKEGRRHQTCGVESYRVLACPEFEKG